MKTGFVESLDLPQLYDRVLSREGEAGRPAADPAVLLSLWLHATIEGVGSAHGLWCKRWRSSQAGAGTRRRSSSEGRIPNLRCGFIFDAKLAEFELILPDPVHEFDAGDRRRCSKRLRPSIGPSRNLIDR
jgi:hypothetical protein